MEFQTLLKGKPVFCWINHSKELSRKEAVVDLKKSFPPNEYTMRGEHIANISVVTVSRK